MLITTSLTSTSLQPADLCDIPTVLAIATYRETSFAYNPAVERGRQEDQKPIAILYYTWSFRPVWDM